MKNLPRIWINTFRSKIFGGFLLSLLLILANFPSLASRAFALSPDDLIIVFNIKLEESKRVATYYAKMRKVPLSNLVGVDVSKSERMVRSEFETQLIPPVLAAVARLRNERKDPAILLIYGIPLCVEDLPHRKPSESFVAFADGKVREYRNLVVQMITELYQLIDENIPIADQPNSLRDTQSIKDVLTMARQSLKRGVQYLKKEQATENSSNTILKVSSLLIKLTGTSPATVGFLVKMRKEDKKDQTLLQSQALVRWNAILRTDLLERSFWGIFPENALEIASAVRLIDGIVGELKFWDEVKRLYQDGETSASVDSELILIMAGLYQRAKWLPNPFHARYERLPLIEKIREKALMVGRLDGPTPETAKRLVDDAIDTEKVGLRGTFYIDARGLAKNNTVHSPYSWYDQHLFNLYHILQDKSLMKVVIDKGLALFPVGACPHAALYCGWYSLGNYVNSFEWQKGAVGFHVASAEASTLRKPESNVWCKRMIEEGVAATIGPVEEPYLTSFPLPDHFFPLLMSGKFPLLEVYFKTTPYVSWRQILIGDPLYMPFKKNPAISLPSEKETESSSGNEGIGGTD